MRLSVSLTGGQPSELHIAYPLLLAFRLTALQTDIQTDIQTDLQTGDLFTLYYGPQSE